MDNPAAAADLLEQLRTVGVGLSIDDFVTGYSSLSSLRRIAVDRVKIDQSFVEGLDHDTPDETLVAAIVAMASALRVTTVAEGVETARQGNHLHELGCDVAQGNFYSRPIPAASVPDVVDKLSVARRSHLKVVPIRSLPERSYGSSGVRVTSGEQVREDRLRSSGRTAGSSPRPSYRISYIDGSSVWSRGSTRRDRSTRGGLRVSRDTGAAPDRRRAETPGTSPPGSGSAPRGRES